MIIKHKSNPIIKPGDVKPSIEGYKVLGAFNPGAINFGDEIVLLLRVSEGCKTREGYIRTPVCRFENGMSYPDIVELKSSDPEVILKDTRSIAYKGQEYLSTISHIRLARSKDGINFNVEDKPFIYPADETEKYGVEDARVIFIDGKYYINYTAVSEDSWATALAITEDFKSIERKGLIFYPENKDVAIFPEKVKGKYIALHRPNNSRFGKPSIWYSESPDLLHWGNHKCIVRPRDNKWESQRIGAGAPPIRTFDGWLVIYHGRGDNNVYSLFCLLLDLEEPSRVVRRASTPLLAPTEPYETEGFFPNVVFSNGIAEKDGKIYVYYGASDDSVNVVITDINSLLGSF
ncbi:MAG: glycoside hydrolase family 130 protein [Candidatus Syntrophoarchaeum sp.]|nr:glycoside hydrolase family 130 protein [Methanomicrobia archaeon]MBL7118346.1 glycoside hydrolase family 130 protein [Candidatus Syntrophoarchaeum sp.]